MPTLESPRLLGREGDLGVSEGGTGGDVAARPLGGVRFSGARSDPVDAFLRCGLVSARRTIVAGESVVENGGLQPPAFDEVLARHNPISHEWQGADV